MTDTSLKDKLLVPASRVAKIVVGFGLTYAAVHWQLAVPSGYEWLRELIEQLIAVAMASALAGLAVHYGVGIKANPRDTVSPTEAKEGRRVKKARKQTRAIEERLNARKEEPPAPLPPNSPEIPPHYFGE